MKRLLWLFWCVPLLAQDVTPHDLTLKDALSILADYEIRHAEQQPFYRPAFGATTFDSNPPAIWLFNTGDTMTRRSTLIHELLHVHYHQLGMNPPEDFIDSEEQRIYSLIFQ